MSNHLHLIAAADDGINLSDILRDMKKFSSKRIVKEMQEHPESRQEWMLQRFAYAGKFEANVKEYKFWQDGNQAKECHSPAFLFEKLNYVHQNLDCRTLFYGSGWEKNTFQFLTKSEKKAIAKCHARVMHF